MTSTASDLSPLIREQVMEEMAILKDSPQRRFRTLLSLFPMIEGRGESIKWPVNHTGSTGVSFDPENDDYSDTGDQGIAEAVLPWKYIHTSVKISGKAQDVSRGVMYNDGNVVAQLVEEATRDLMLTLESQLAGDGTGNSGKDITGIKAAVAASGTYAGVDRSSNTWWQSHINDVSGSWSEAEMQESLQAVLNQPRNGRINLGITGPAQYHKIANALKNSNPVQFVNTAEIGAGITALYYDGIPIVRIAGYDNDRLDLINTEDFEIVVIRDVKVRQLGAVNDNDEYAISFGCNLRCRNPRAQGALINLT